ncbi:MAG: hypothetical protein J6D54_05505 [Olsenella sp.]|nr:hypothetical protein [Olsenella sp.]
MAMLAVGVDPDNLREISMDPSVMDWGLQDISASDAGRVHDAGNSMYKMRTSQKRKLNLTWAEPTAAQTAEILQAFNPEYIWVRYPDAMSGALETREFYVGDRSAPVRWYQLPGRENRYKTLSFNIIER